MSLEGHVATAPAVFPSDGRRAVIYVVYDRRGDVDDYVVHALQGLREHASHILAVVNGKLTPRGQARLAAVTDDVLLRDNVGFDIWAQKDALSHIGAGLAGFDEVVLTNDTWFGPVRPYGPVFERMNAQEVHFWGMTDHERQVPNPFTGTGAMPYHLQSYWLAVRPGMFLSEEWERYWRELPGMPTYIDAVLKHEVVFTERFSALGFVAQAAFGYVDYDTVNPSLFNADALLDDGCPTLKRRPLFHYPPFLDRHAVIGRWTLEAAESYGFPVEMILHNLARNVPPKILNTDAGLLSVLDDVDTDYDHSRPLRTLVIAHIFYPDMTDEMLDRADTLPSGYDLVITTPDASRAAEIEAVVARRPSRGNVEVRLLASNNGRDQSAFLIACRDVLRGDAYDVVVKIHSKKTPQDGRNVGRHFKLQQFDNLLNSPGFTANLLALFQREPGLGLAFPPTIHIGYPTMGRGWWSNKAGFELLSEKLRIQVPLDDISPLAPYGSMFVARPEALRLLVEHEWSYSDFGGAEAYKDGGLAHILERMPAYAAAELGYHSRTVATFEYMSISHTSLEFKLDEMGATIPGFPIDKIEFLRSAGYVNKGSGGDFLRMYMRRNHMGLVHKMRRMMDPGRWPGGWISTSRSRLKNVIGLWMRSRTSGS